MQEAGGFKRRRFGVRSPKNRGICWFRRLPFCAAIGLLFPALSGTLPQSAVGFQLKAADPVGPETLGLLETHCFGCHGDDEPEAGLNLAHFKTVGSVRKDRDTWEKVLRRVAAGSMPPADSSSISDDERAALGKWVDDVLHNVDCSDALQPGHVTIRRLNRGEYRHTIQDLLLVDYEPASAFPGDDAGYGFDNIGDVLSLPPVLMEKYLSAAEAISRQVIQAPEDFLPVETPLELADFRFDNDTNRTTEGLAFLTTGEASCTIDQAGKFEGQLRLRVVGQQAGDEPCRMTVHVDRRKLGSWKVTGDDQQETIDIPLRMGKGQRKIRIAFDNDFYDPDAPGGKQDRNLIVQAVTLVAGSMAPAEPSAAHQNFFFAVAANKTDEEPVVRKLLGVWASRLFRRPASEGEIDRLTAVFKAARADEASFEQSMQYALQAILTSPKFLFKVEQPPPTDGTPRRLNSYELATSLSYFLWNSTPDGALLKTAHERDLQDDDVLRAEVRRLLADPRADRMIRSFASQWLQLRALDLSQPDPQLFAGVDRELLADMREETETFCADVFRNNRSLLDLMSADYTFVNRRLAAHYGLPEVGADDGFVRVSLAETARRGVLTHGSILTVTSNPNRTSPVKRGRWILENILGEPPPPALPEIMPLEQQKLTGTLRQQMEQHRENPSCASCHSTMDPLGFALENFDAVGRWRTEDGGGLVDASGELPSGETFSGAVELLQVLQEKKQRQFIRCLAEKMMIYALGRGLRYEDQCAVNEVLKRLEAHGCEFEELILGIVESPPFRQRQREKN